MNVAVLHECDVLRATRARSDDASVGADAARVRAVYRAYGLRAPVCVAGYDWRARDGVGSGRVLLVDASLPFDAQARQEIHDLERDTDLVFRPLRHEDHDPDFTRADDNSPQRQKIADALMLMHFPREGVDASIVSMSARSVPDISRSTETDDRDFEEQKKTDDAAGFSAAEQQPIVASVVVACTHPGYVHAGAVPPHLFMRMLNAPVVYVHARPHADAARAPSVAEHVASAVEDACRIA